MLTQRDKEVLTFLNRYGKTYLEVLGETFFNNIQVARNRINKLAKDGLIGYWNTGLMKPRRALVLTKDSREYLENELGLEPKNAKINKSTIEHNVIEQIADYHLQKIGTVERTTVYKHFSKLHHVPDFIFTNDNGSRFYIEVELTKKSQARYKSIVHSMSRDNPNGIVYVTDTKERASAIAKTMPIWDKLYFIDIQTLVSNITEHGKLRPTKQGDF